MLWIMVLAGFCGTFIFGELLRGELRVCSLFKDEVAIREYARNMCISLLIGLVGFFGLLGIESMSYEEVSQTGVWEVLALQSDNSQIYVTIDSRGYSFWYKKDDDIKNYTIKDEKVIIYESDDCTPHIIEYTFEIKNKMNIGLRILLAFGAGEASEKRYEIYIPKESVRKNYKLKSVSQ